MATGHLHRPQPTRRRSRGILIIGNPRTPLQHRVETLTSRSSGRRLTGARPHQLRSMRWRAIVINAPSPPTPRRCRDTRAPPRPWRSGLRSPGSRAAVSRPRCWKCIHHAAESRSCSMSMAIGWPRPRCASSRSGRSRRRQHHFLRLHPGDDGLSVAVGQRVGNMRVIQLLRHLRHRRAHVPALRRCYCSPIQA